MRIVAGNGIKEDTRFVHEIHDSAWLRDGGAQHPTEQSRLDVFLGSDLCSVSHNDTEIFIAI